MALLLAACADKRETTQPAQGPITESVYASGIVESKDQYEVFATVSGIVQEVYVKEGDTVQAGTPLLMIQNEAQRLNRENARCARARVFPSSVVFGGLQPTYDFFLPSRIKCPAGFPYRRDFQHLVGLKWKRSVTEDIWHPSPPLRVTA